MASLFDHLSEVDAVSQNPVRGVKRPKAEGNEGKTPAVGGGQAGVVRPKPPKIPSPVLNSAILSRLLTKYGASGSAKTLALVKKLSAAVWRHIHLSGHYPFRGDGGLIDLDAIVAGLELG